MLQNYYKVDDGTFKDYLQKLQIDLSSDLIKKLKTKRLWFNTESFVLILIVLSADELAISHKIFGLTTSTC